ncbi:MAG: tetratricopeptide repeat protein [Rubrivivax sp.]|nr:tetratricopeptide repeat protein [Pyrinomonadaceae bacterium]
MRQARLLLLAMLVAAFAGEITQAQTGRREAQESIRRGNEKYARAEYEPAIEEYRRVGPGDDYAQSLYNIGVCYYELWRTEDAIAMYRKAVEAKKGIYPKASYALGIALKDAGRPREAKEAYREAIAASSGEHAAAHYMLGLLVAGEGDNEQAAALFREAIARSGDGFPASRNNLGVTLARMGRLSEAEREFAQALRQSDGVFDDAARNLKLCRSLLSTHANGQLSSLKMVETAKGQNK